MPANRISELVSNIQGSAQGLIDNIRGERTLDAPLHPSDKDVSSILSDINPQNWNHLIFPYTFGVVDLDGSGLVDLPFTDFALPIAPQSISQSEEFAINITPTVGGTVISHNGNRYKSLKIKGTTGVHPFRGSGGVNKRTGEAIFQPKALKYLSGYEVFLRLRNYFRSYYEFKKNRSEEANGYRLIFKNFKDGEFLIVELLSFNMERQAAGSFLYDYDLEFKVLAPLQSFELANRFTNLQDSFDRAVELIDEARGVFLRTQGILRQIEATYNDIVIEPLRKVNLAIKALLGIGTVAADIGERVIQNTLSTASTLLLTLGIKRSQDANLITGTLDPRLANITLPTDLKATVELQKAKFINTFEEGLMAIDSSEFPQVVQDAHVEEQAQILATPRIFYEDLIVDLRRVLRNAEDFFGLGDPTLDTLFDRTATLTAVPSKIITPEELEVLGAFNEAIRGIQLILATEELFRTELNDRVNDLVSRFEGNIELNTPTAVREVVLKSQDTLEKLAQRYLKDSTRWPEIVELNFLKSPYLTDDLSSTLEGVLKPGDTILIPTSLVSGFSQAPQGKQRSDETQVSEVIKSLGRDFRLTPGFDVALTQTGDFDTISGPDNIAQAIITKLSFEKGDLLRYPTIGSGLNIGDKFPPLDEIRDGVVNTLLSDPRIRGVEGLRLERNGSELSLNFEVRLKLIDIPVPISIPVV